MKSGQQLTHLLPRLMHIEPGSWWNYEVAYRQQTWSLQQSDSHQQMSISLALHGSYFTKQATEIIKWPNQALWQ